MAEVLLPSESTQLLRRGLGGLRLPASSVNPRDTSKDPRQAVRVSELAGKTQRRLAALQSLVGIPHRDQNMSTQREPIHPRIMHEVGETVLLRVIEGEALLQVCAGRDQLPLAR